MTWGNLFRHEILSKDPVIGQMTIKYLRAAKINLVKVSAVYPRNLAVLTNCYHTQSYSIILNCAVCLLQIGFPSKNDCPGCEFSRVDFDSDEDFNCFFNCELLLISN